MKTPITYYGGKQNMLRHILPLIPEHKIYVEPFIGGGAVFWAKTPSKVEIINDTNQNITNFYQVVKNHYRKLQREIKATLHSRDMHRKAQVMYANPDMFSPLQRAWSVWVLANQSFASIFNGGWAYANNDDGVEKRLDNKRQSFARDYALRLDRVQIECTDALRIIKVRDTENTFFYCDPPYFNSDCGHYKGYTEHDFKELLETLAHVKGKFLLSSYPSEILKAHIEKHGWYWTSVEKKVAVSKFSTKRKIEVLIANYPLA